MKHHQLRFLIIAVALYCSSAGMSGAQEVVGGITPSLRPANAPRITQVDHDRIWYVQALAGISQPYPASLKFLDAQGNWYTPFNRRGMPSYYDIRNLHGPR